MTEQGASAVGIATITSGGAVLDTWFPAPALGEFNEAGTVLLTGEDIPGDLRLLVGPDPARDVEVIAVRTTIADLSAAPINTHDAYCTLHLLSSRLVQPHGLNLDGIFGHLPNVVWTNFGPVPE